MLKAKFISLLIVLILNSASIILLNPVSSENINLSNKYNNIYDDSQHIIQGVPYVHQRNMYCHFASITMICQYYGINTTQDEVSHICGVGYSTASLPKIIDRPFIGPPYNSQAWAGFEVSHGDDDLRFLSILYGLTYKCHQPKTSEEYWHITKQYLKNDIPIITWLDASVIPDYNLSTNIFTMLICGHSIVIVGFNESNSTVCFNNPGLGEENGSYQFLDLNTFLKGVSFVILDNNNYPLRNTIKVFEKIDKPLPRDIAYKLVHQRNIERIKGNPQAYDQKLIQENFHKTGVNSIKSIKTTFKPINFLINYIPKIPIYKVFNLIVKTLSNIPYDYPFTDIILSFRWIYNEKQIISQYLFENKNISPICENDAILLELESKYWANITSLTENLNNIVKNNCGLLKIFFLSKPILEEIIETFDHIVLIEELIIASN